VVGRAVGAVPLMRRIHELAQSGVRILPSQDEPSDSSALATGSSIASAFQACHDTVLDTFRKRLIGACGPLGIEEALLNQATIQARQVLADVTESIRTGQIQVDETAIALAWQAGAARTGNLHPAESLRAAIELFEPALDAVIETAAGHPDAICVIRTATQALQRSVMTRVRWASEAYVGFLLDRVHQAQLAERRRFARELHDRVGGSASVVTRNLELAKSYADTNRDRSYDKIDVAYQASVHTLEAVRGVATDLRLESKFDNSLKQALRGFLDVMGEGNAAVELAVNGDESWVPAEVLAEVFLVAREALRNAFRHSDAHTILSNVDIAPHEIRVWVSDDGVGFDPNGAATSGSGLASMRERIELLGGKLMLHSTPGRGTRIEAFIPLPRTTK